MVQKAMTAGDIMNTSPTGVDPYPQEKFDHPLIGPNMHQVNEGLIKPWTAQGHNFVPGASWALHQNHTEGGLQCNVFISHAWNEGVYEFIENALRAWPADSEGAYICCLSNPQNLDIGAVLGDRIEDSPFHRILVENPRPDKMVVVANSNTPIHQRAWCALEAHCARKGNIGILVAGDPLHLLTGDAKQFRDVRDADRKAQRVLQRVLEDSTPGQLSANPDAKGQDGPHPRVLVDSTTQQSSAKPDAKVQDEQHSSQRLSSEGSPSRRLSAAGMIGGSAAIGGAMMMSGGTMIQGMFQKTANMLGPHAPEADLNDDEMMTNEMMTNEMTRHLRKMADVSAGALADVKLFVLERSSHHLINLRASSCTRNEDKHKIHQIILNDDEGGGQQLTNLLASLIKDSICDAPHVLITAGGEDRYSDPSATGTFQLSLDEAVVDVSGKGVDLSSPVQLLQLMSWLRASPLVTKLKLRACSVDMRAVRLITDVLPSPK